MITRITRILKKVGMLTKFSNGITFIAGGFNE